MSRDYQAERILQIYPDSFKDSNSDGIGDLNGITEMLEELKGTLHLDAIWISPFFLSPPGKEGDGGYAVSDYRQVAPRFGTMEDFERLIAEANRLGVRIYTDFVPCHTSTKHEWFEASRNPNHPKHEAFKDYYVWHDGKRDPETGDLLYGEDGKPLLPNNWRNCFDDGPAWTWDEGRQAYYLRHFSEFQPALDLNNPMVQDAILAEMRFWLQKGIHGMRIDALPFAIHGDLDKDNPLMGNHDSGQWSAHYFEHSICQPGIIPFSQRITALFNEFGATSLAEAIAGPYGGAGAAELAGQMIADVEQGGGGLSTAYTDLSIGTFWGYPRVYRDDGVDLFNMIRAMQAHSPDGKFTTSISNHDFDLIAERATWGMPQGLHDTIIKQVFALGLSLPGSYCAYQYEVLGLRNARVPEDIPPELLVDPDQRKRERFRTPFPWNEAEPNAGFSTVPADQLVRPLAASHLPRAWATQKRQPNSMLNFASAMLQEWENNPALRDGEFQLLESDDPNLFVFLRKGGGQTILHAFNMSGDSRYIEPLNLRYADTGQKIHVNDLRAAGLDRQERRGRIKIYPHAFTRFGVRELAPVVEAINEHLDATQIPEPPQGVKRVFAPEMIPLDYPWDRQALNAGSDAYPTFEADFPRGKELIKPEEFDAIAAANPNHAPGSIGGSVAAVMWTVQQMLGDNVWSTMLTTIPDTEEGQIIRQKMAEGGVKLITPDWADDVDPRVARSQVVRRSGDGFPSVLTDPGNVSLAMERALQQPGNADLIERAVMESDVVILPGALTQRFGQTFTDKVLADRWWHQKELILMLPVHAEFGNEDTSTFQNAIPSANVVVGSDREFARLYHLPNERPIQAEHIKTIVARIQEAFQANILEIEDLPRPHEQVAFIKRGDLPALLITRDRVVEVPVIEVDAAQQRNHTGDGKASNAGFIAGYLMGFTHEQSAQLAMEMAAEKIKQTTPEAHLTNPHATFEAILARMADAQTQSETPDRSTGAGQGQG